MENRLNASEEPCVGLIGGIAVGASCEYYKRLVQAAEREHIKLRLVLVHADLALVLQHLRMHDAEGLGSYFGDLVSQLAGASATCAAITSVASHMGYREATKCSPIPLVSILTAIRSEVERLRFNKVALFGSRFAMETEMYGALKDTTEVVKLNAKETSEIDSIYMALAHQGYASPQQEKSLTNLAEAAVKREKIDAIIFAGTDMSVMYGGQRRPRFPYLDSTHVHVEAILRVCREQKSS